MLGHPGPSERGCKETARNSAWCWGRGLGSGGRAPLSRWGWKIFDGIWRTFYLGTGPTPVVLITPHSRLEKMEGTKATVGLHPITAALHRGFQTSCPRTPRVQACSPGYRGQPPCAFCPPVNFGGLPMPCSNSLSLHQPAMRPEGLDPEMARAPRWLLGNLFHNRWGKKRSWRMPCP